MSVAKTVRSFVDTVRLGEVFTYDDIPSNQTSAIAIELSRLNKQGIIQRISKGKYYKPKQGRFGKLPPSDEEVINSYLRSSKSKGYVTGLRAFNQMGLTTQVPNTITIASEGSAKKIKVKNINIEFVPLKQKVLKSETKFAQLLDALENIKKIPDTVPDDVVSYSKDYIAKLQRKEQGKIARLAQKYRPRTRAIVGALLKELGNWEDAFKLKETLNSMSTYKIGLSNDVLKDKANWKIQ